MNSEHYCEKISQLAAFMESGDNFLIITHENPDGDAFGSAFALHNFLRENGKKAEVLMPDSLPERYRNFIPGSYRSELDYFELNSYSCCFLLDTPAETRAALGPNMGFDNIAVELINIDHHPDNNINGRINLVAPDRAATSEILLELFLKCEKWKISAKTADLLMLALIMDTGCFRFDNTSSKCFASAAKLMQLGVNYHKIINAMFFSVPMPFLQFSSELMSKALHISCNGRFAWIMVDEQLIRKYEIDMRNSEGLIDLLRSMQGPEIIALVHKRFNGFKVSLRSKNPQFSVGKIARKLNGGGHEMAAGGIIHARSPEAAANILTDHVKEVLDGEKEV